MRCILDDTGAAHRQSCSSPESDTTQKPTPSNADTSNDSAQYGDYVPNSDTRSATRNDPLPHTTPTLSPPDMTLEEFMEASKRLKHIRDEYPGANIYYKTTVYGGTIHNGHHFDGSQNPGSKGAVQVEPTQLVFVNTYATDGTQVHNGDTFEFWDRGTHALPSRPAIYFNNTTIPSTSGTSGQGTMHNGNRFIIKNRQR